ncbi:MAG: DUF2752 domain-containing protein [Microthrixaceae bacterium]
MIPESTTAPAAPCTDRSHGRGQRIAAPLALGAIALAGCVAVAAADPGDDGVPLCWSRTVFGVDCPFCGGLRATNSLVRLDPGAAADHNIVLTVLMPVAVLMWVLWLVRRWRGEPEVPRTPNWLVVTAGVLVVAFGVVRNFGGPAWIRWLHSDSFAG